MPSVLVIDDDACLRGVITSTFRRMGYEAHGAENGRAGLAHFEAEPADLVVTAIFMPVMDGLEVITALRASAHIPAVIAISGDGVMCGTDALYTAKMLGADAVLPKPLTMGALLNIAGELLAEGARRSLPDAAQRKHVPAARGLGPPLRWSVTSATK